eukprot:TRINITY_DN7151_c0_g1_i1.p1 TRINITY_DN7151_c0_g1~~TRINITY_DN7151_c0_g1_i1.p1  ORF type:complete len:145 (+),score=16.00 TRINITY_DN7151_c0_g1_i1:87-521(+)
MSRRSSRLHDGDSIEVPLSPQNKSHFLPSTPPRIRTRSDGSTSRSQPTTSNSLAKSKPVGDSPQVRRSSRRASRSSVDSTFSPSFSAHKPSNKRKREIERSSPRPSKRLRSTSSPRRTLRFPVQKRGKSSVHERDRELDESGSA